MATMGKKGALDLCPVPPRFDRLMPPGSLRLISKWQSRTAYRAGNVSMIMASPSTGVVSAKSVPGEPDQTVRAGRVRHSLRKSERNGFRNDMRKTRISHLDPRPPTGNPWSIKSSSSCPPDPAPPALLPLQSSADEATSNPDPRHGPISCKPLIFLHSMCSCYTGTTG